MRYRCLNPACRRVVDKVKYEYHHEVICKACWVKIHPLLTSQYYKTMRSWRRAEKIELMYQVNEGWAFQRLAKDLAKIWAKIRDELGVEPFLAGLTYFLIETFDGRKNPLPQSEMPAHVRADTEE